jgi:hypothetical protein
MARILSLVLFIVGLAGAIIYPAVFSGSDGTPLGTFEVWKREQGALVATVTLEPYDAPVELDIRLISSTADTPADSVTEVEMIVAQLGDIVSNATVRVSGGDGLFRLAESDPPAFGLPAARIENVRRGEYTLLAQPTGDEGIPVSSLEISVRRNVVQPNELVRPTGAVFAFLGFVGLFLSAIQPRTRPMTLGPQPKSRAPIPRWGRNAGRK